MSRTKRWWLCPACRQPKKDHADDCTEEKRAVAKELLKMRKKKGKQSRRNRALYELLQKAQTGGKNDIAKRVKLGPGKSNPEPVNKPSSSGSEVTEAIKLEPASPKSSAGSDNKPLTCGSEVTETMKLEPASPKSSTGADNKPFICGSEVTETMKLEPASPKSSNGSDNKPFIFDVDLAPTMTEKPSLTTSITKALI